MTNELIAKAKECKSAEELLALAKESGIEMTAREAEARFASISGEGELSDNELESAAGGGCDNQSTVNICGKKYTVVSSAVTCFTGEFTYAYEQDRCLREDDQGLRAAWALFSGARGCGRCLHLEFTSAGLGYCGKSGR